MKPSGSNILIGLITALTVAATATFAGVATRTMANTDVPGVAGVVTFTYQGRLTDASGNPVTTAKQMRFRMSDSAFSTIYDSGTSSVTPDAAGLFTVLLGNAPWAQLPATTLSSAINIRVTVDGEDMPSQPLSTVAGHSFSSLAVSGHSVNGTGVYGFSKTSVGVEGRSNGTSADSHAGLFSSSAPSATLAVFNTGSAGAAVRANGNNLGVSAETSLSTGTAFQAIGNARQTITDTGLIKASYRVVLTSTSTVTTRCDYEFVYAGVAPSCRGFTSSAVTGSNGVYTLTAPAPIEGRTIALTMQSNGGTLPGQAGPVIPYAFIHSFPTPNSMRVHVLNAFNGATVTGTLHILIH